MTFAFETAQQLAARVAKKEISALELTQYFIDRIEKYDERLNAVVVRDFERARANAKKLDELQASGAQLGPLHGVPMTIKESYNIEGLTTHWGIEPLKNNVATEDAHYVTALKQAGANFLGKTNVPVNLGDFQSFNPIYGTTNNPWDVTRTPGGSSGGSAASLAAGFCGLEAGSDIGGSIRNPAHYCGVFGHKPTFGIVPWQGHSLPGMTKMADIAVVGPLARSADDLRLSMDLVVGPEPINQAGWKLDLPRSGKTQLKDFKVAIWLDESDFSVSQEVRDRVQMVADTLAKAGATVSDSARPQIDATQSYELYLKLLQGALSASIPDDQYQLMQQAPLSELPAGEAKLMTEGAIQDHRTWTALNGQRESFRHAWRQFFQEWDVLVCPIMPTSAFVQDETEMMERTLQIDNQTIPYLRQIFWAGLTGVSYLPSTVFPTGPSKDGLPIGLQAVGAEYFDYQCIEFAHLLEQTIGGFTPPAGYD